MWRKLALALFVGILLVMLATPLWAAAPTSIPFAGTAQTSSSGRLTNLNLSLSAGDGSRWRIETSLNSARPKGSESEDDNENRNSRSAGLNGNFNLARNGNLVSGTASGTISSAGRGQIILVNTAQSVNIQLTFAIAGDSSVTGLATGQFGTIAAVQPAPAATPSVTPQVSVSSPPPDLETSVLAPAVQNQTPKAVAQAPTVQSQIPAQIQPTAQAPISATGSDAAQPPSAPQTHNFWYLSRTAAILAYILLFINIVLGLGMKTRFLERLSARWLNFDLHQFTALLAMGLIGLHIFSLLGDQYMSPTLSNLLIPMSGSYRLIWTALGIISFYILIMIMLSSYLRRFIGQKAWRLIHMLSFVLFYVILYHGLRSGTDTSSLWAQIMYVATGSIAAFLFLWRFLLAGHGQNISLKARIPAEEIEKPGPGS